MSSSVSPRSAGTTIPALFSFLMLSLAMPVIGQAQQPQGAAKTAAKATPTEAALDRLAKQPAIAKAMAALQSENEWTLTEQAALCEIPAPPFKEAARAAAFRDKLAALGVQKLRMDREGNVIGERVATRQELDRPGTDVGVERSPGHGVPRRDQREGEARGHQAHGPRHR